MTEDPAMQMYRALSELHFDDLIEERDRLRTERQDWLRRMQSAENKADQLRERIRQLEERFAEMSTTKEIP